MTDALKSAITAPSNRPNTLPITEIATLSDRNCVMMRRRLAPTALRTPISAVRSVIDISSTIHHAHAAHHYGNTDQETHHQSEHAEAQFQVFHHFQAGHRLHRLLDGGEALGEPAIDEFLTGPHVLDALKVDQPGAE